MIIADDGDPGTLSMPISHDEWNIIDKWSKETRHEFEDNVKRYIKQLGEDHHAPTNDAERSQAV